MNEYEKQAQDFLKKTETTIEVVKADKQTPPNWAGENESHGIKYAVTIENRHHKYTFDFWDSIYNAEVVTAIELILAKRYLSSNDSTVFKAEQVIKQALGKKTRAKSVLTERKKEFEPTAYSVLACLHPMYASSLEEWCADYGYDPDSRKAYNTYQLVLEEDQNMRKLWDRSELELLQEIA